uniref:transposase n=1 Tax=Staphylococcus chromogenes TaxID=46126 RepID=UPI00227828F1|nr:transposase [Staphylococcus chromogenes]
MDNKLSYNESNQFTGVFVMSKRKYDHSFKMEAIQLVESGRKATEVSRDLDIPIQTLTKWLSVYRKEGEKGFVGSGRRTPKKQSEVDLQKRLKELEEENKILKKTMHIFAKDQK